jgi:hypothetical protein
MIFYLVRSDHAAMEYVTSWGPKPGSRMQFLFYEELPEKKSTLPGTYLFTDLETLSCEQLEMANHFCEQLKRGEKGVRILNHPGRATRRYELLHKLHEARINCFRAVRATDPLDGLRFPVFIRREDEHTGTRTPLLYSLEQLKVTLLLLKLLGHRLSDLLVMEFCDTRDAAGVFRKYSAFIVADKILPRHVIFSRHWIVKRPELTDDQLMREQQQYLEENPHESSLREIFRLAQIDYGRIDYGLLGDDLQVWEINTHPTVNKITPRLTMAFESIDCAVEDHNTIPIAFDETMVRRVRRETNRRNHNLMLRTILANGVSLTPLKPIAQTVKKWLRVDRLGDFRVPDGHVNCPVGYKTSIR